jgi:hypothetical protein
VVTAEDDEAEGALLLDDCSSLVCGGFSRLTLNTTEFFGIGEDDVHVLYNRRVSFVSTRREVQDTHLVEGQQSSGELTTVRHGYPHPVVDLEGSC